MKYRKKPVTVDAVRYYNGIIFPIDDWVNNALDSGVLFRDTNFDMNVYTPEGTLLVSDGDYIIRGVQGEIYPCKPDIFEQTYEAVKEGKE